MSVSRIFKCALLVLLPAIAVATPPALAQNVDAMAKWTALKVVHYRVVANFTGDTQLFAGNQRNRKARATDRFEIEFDWNQEDMKLAGKATFKNFQTTFTPHPIQGCPAIRIVGALEVATVLSIKDMSPGILTIDLTRELPGGAVPWTEDDKPCGSLWDKVAPKSETAQQMLQVIPAMALAMPGLAEITPDGKSLVVKGGDGWTWTFTPTPVK
jgi:hypothetical protein